MRIDILTLFPEMCCEVLRESVIGRARERGCVEINCRNIRDYTLDKHNRVDDSPYGGGTGMIMQVQPIYDCYESLCRDTGTRFWVSVFPCGVRYMRCGRVPVSRQRDS